MTARGNDVVVACYKALGVCYRVGSADPFAWIAVAPAVAALLIGTHLSLAVGCGSENDCLGYTVLSTIKVDR
ncbi:MAG: hypothetical protein EBU40_15095 [Proteobacteria bacterium]|nr:hypothetical protein [Pseudomonadota bacterium]